MQLLTDLLYNLFSFLTIISLIAFVHELGHYYIAKISGVKIEVFSIGFGPEIFGFNDKSKTRWKFCLFPLGGYVKMFGDKDPASSYNQELINSLSKEEYNLAFGTKSLSTKAKIVAAGPIANFIFAIIILTVLFYYYGRPYAKPIIDDIAPNSVAQLAGFKKGDQVIQINKSKINSFEEIKKIINISPQSELTFLLRREDQLITKKITPTLTEYLAEDGSMINIGVVGIISNNIVHKKFNILSSIIEANNEVINISFLTLKSLIEMLIKQKNIEQLGGPIKIAKYSAQSMKKGFGSVLWLMAILSINLGLINLFPIPLLDGGHLLFYFIEAIKGRPIDDLTRRYSYQIGFLLIVMLMLFSTFNDLKTSKLF